MTDEATIGTYESVVEEYRERHADRSVVEHLVEGFLDGVEAVADPARIADVGCGPGWESSTFEERGHDVVGIDLTPAFLRAAREEAPDVAFARMDMRDLGVRASSFDGLWVCASFLHVPREDAPGTLAEFRRVLRDGGVLCLSVKRGEGTMEGNAYEGDRRQFVLYRPDELRELLAEAGFDVTSIDVGSTGQNDWVVTHARA